MAQRRKREAPTELTTRKDILAGARTSEKTRTALQPTPRNRPCARRYQVQSTLVSAPLSLQTNFIFHVLSRGSILSYRNWLPSRAFEEFTLAGLTDELPIPRGGTRDYNTLEFTITSQVPAVCLVS